MQVLFVTKTKRINQTLHKLMLITVEIKSPQFPTKHYINIC